MKSKYVYQTQAGLVMENGMGQDSLEVMADSKGCWVDSFPLGGIYGMKGWGHDERVVL